MNSNRRPLRWTSRLRLVAGALIAFFFLSPAPAAGQARPAETSWRVILLPQVDLWYHGLATAEFQGFGPDPLYDAGYPERVQAAKGEAGVLPTVLDERAAEFAAEFRRDQTFEVFHFVPLYFASSNVEPMLGALDQVAASPGTPVVDDMLAQFGANAVASTIAGGDRRIVLGEWSQTLQTEWEAFYADYWMTRAIESGPFIQSVQAEWDQNFAPRLAGYLRAYALADGILVLSDPVGPEGRIFEGDPANPADNVIVVGFDAGVDPRSPLFAAVREMCFPVVREVLAAQPAAPNRTVAATRSSHAAVRCGAYLLDRFAPDLAPAYRSRFASEASGSPAAVATAFDLQYPIDPALRAAIEEKLGLVPGP